MTAVKHNSHSEYYRSFQKKENPERHFYPSCTLALKMSFTCVPAQGPGLRAWWMALCVKQKERKGGSPGGQLSRVHSGEHSEARNQPAKHQLSTVPMLTTVTIIIRTHHTTAGHALPASGAGPQREARRFMERTETEIH